MHAVMVALVELQKLEFGAPSDSPETKAAVDNLRTQVPLQILSHYDRLRARGKKGLSLVRDNKVCTECHMQVPLGTVITVMKGLDIQLCGNCGRYLYVEEKPVEPEAPPAPKAKRGRKPRKKIEENVA